MSEWYSAQYLAQKQLPGLPETVSAIIRRAKKDGWKSRSREFGKGLEYHLSSFPIDTQAALLKAEARQFIAENPLPLVIKPTPALPDPALKDAGDAMAAHLSGKPLARMDAKINIMHEFRRFVRATPVTGTQKPGGQLHKEAFAAAWNRGEIDSKAVAVIPRLAVDKLDRISKTLRHYGLGGLAGRYGNRRGHTLIDQQPQLAVALRSILVETPHISHVHAHEFLCARYHRSDLRLPSQKTVARWITDWKAVNHSLFCKLSDPDRWKSTYQSAIGDASAAIIALNQEWQADSTPADLELADGRHNLVFLLDVYSRRLKIQVSKTSTAAAIAAVLRRGLLDWGVPETLKTDNGADYVSDHIRRICHTLDIQHHLCAPFTPEGKGHVERHVQTFSHDLLELLPGYIGHNVAERQALRAREQFSDRLGVKGSVVKLAHSAADLQAFCDRWCDAYHDRPHRGLHTQTPNQVVASWHKRGHPIRRIADDRILDILLAPAPSGDGWRVVGKGDHIKVDKFGYNATALALHVGDRVRVMYDETDMGKVYVFDGFGRFLAIAECPEVAGLDRRQIAMDSKTAQRLDTNRRVKAAKAESKKTLSGPALVETALSHRAELAREVLPSPAGGRGAGGEGDFIEHATPHIEGAARALTGQDEISHRLNPPMLAQMDDCYYLPQTFLHDLLEYAPGYIGHNVAERQALRARQQFSDRLGVKGSSVKLSLTAADLQEFCNRWCDAYHNRPHRGLDGQTPNQIVNAWQQPIRRIADDRILDILLAPAPSGDGWRVVGKGDHIKVDKFGYNATALALHVGDRVRVMYDETDMGKVYVFDGFGRFLAIAECPELTGLDRRQFAIDCKAIQRIASNRDAKAAKAESKKTLKGPAAVEALLDYRAELAKEILPSPAGGRGVGGEGDFIEHATPHVEGATRALTGQDEISRRLNPPMLAQMDDCYHLPPVPEAAPVVIAHPEQRRTYNDCEDRIRDVFARSIKQGIEPDADDLWVLHDFYDDRRYPDVIRRTHDSLRLEYRKTDVDALKQRWLALPVTQTA